MSGERWTPAEEAQLIVGFDTATPQQLAERLGRSVDAVRKKCQELRLFKRDKWEPYEDEILVDMWGEHTGVEIAEVLSRGPNAISRRARKLGLESQKPPDWTKADDNYVLMSVGDIPVEEMAEHLGRSEAAVRHRISLLNVSSSQGKRRLADAADILGIGVGTLVRRLKKVRAQYVVVDGCGDVTDDMIVKVAKHMIKKPNATGPCNVSVRHLQQVVAEYGGDVKKKRARKTGKRES